MSRVVFRDPRAAIYLIASLLQATATLILLPLAAKVIDAEQMGQVYFTYATAVPTGILLSVGAPASITRFHLVVGRPDQARQLAIVTGVPFIGTGLFLVGGDSGVLVMVAAMACGVAQSQCLLSLFRAQGRANSYALVVASAYLFPTSTATLALYTGALHSGTSFLTLSVSVQLVGIGIATIFAALGPRTWRLPIREIARFSLPLLPHSTALTAFAALDKLTLEYLYDSSTVAHYQYAFLFGSAGIAGANALNNLYAPLLLSRPVSQDRARYEEVLAQQFSVCVFLAGATILLAPTAAIAMLPAGYPRVETLVVASISGVCVLPYGWYLSRIHRYILDGKTASLALTTPLSAGIALFLCLLLAKEFGLIGAAVGVFLGYVGLAGLTSIFGREDAQIRALSLRFSFAFLLLSVGVSVGMLILSPPLAIRFVMVATALGFLPPIFLLTRVR